jgi:hypothetical protein
MLEVGICSSLQSPKLTKMLQWCSNLMIMLAREDSFCGNMVFRMNFYFCCPITCAFSKQSWSVCDDLFCQCRFSPTVPLRWWRLPMIRECRHNLRNCRSRYT